jgi:aspartate ammonia-lyase
MNVDVLIYVNTLKEFFKKDEQAFQDMFGTLEIDKDLYFEKLTSIATQNFKDTGIPTLSTIQMFDIVKEMVIVTAETDKLLDTLKKETPSPFVNFNRDFPPYCLN